MSKRDTKNKEVGKMIDYYRKFPDEKLISMAKTASSFSRDEYKTAFNIVLKERGLDNI